MSVWIYKGQEPSLIPPERLQAHLEQGYTVVPAPTAKEADTNDTGKLSNSEVRAAAKEAGLENWENGRIKSLKEALGYDYE